MRRHDASQVQIVKARPRDDPVCSRAPGIDIDTENRGPFEARYLAFLETVSFRNRCSMPIGTWIHSTKAAPWSLGSFASPIIAASISCGGVKCSGRPRHKLSCPIPFPRIEHPVLTRNIVYLRKIAGDWSRVSSCKMLKRSPERSDGPVLSKRHYAYAPAYGTSGRSPQRRFRLFPGRTRRSA
jgi:hypothetical protein